MAAFFRLRGDRSDGAPRGAFPRTEDQVRQLLSLLPKYRVLLHNDDYNDMDYVVAALLRTVPGLSVDAAVEIMLEAHTAGVAQVTICLKEQAEYYRERLERYGLTSTIEPA
jgi:ATP-dependent Clp protease adaptor protein ClpS